MPTSTFQRSTNYVIGPNSFVVTEPCNRILPMAMKKHIKRTSRTVGTPRITISTTCLKQSPFSVISSAAKSERSITKALLSVVRTALPPAKFSLPVMIWLPPGASSHMGRLNSWDPKTAVVVGKRLPPLQATHLSGYVSGLGLSRLCITPSTRLKNLRSTASETTNHVPIIISSLSFLSLLFLSSSQSTISLRLLPPYAPRNETSIFVASYGSCSARSLDPGFPPHRDGKHPDTLIKQFRALLHNSQDPAHRVGIYSGMRELIKYMRRNQTFILDEQLHAMVLCIYHGIQVQVEGLEGELISQMCR
jgi:hypothetical protein